MISLIATLWIMIALFAVVDAQRGWTRAVIASAGLILSLFAMNQFGAFLFGFLGHYEQGINETIWRRQILILTAFHLFITFFSYAGPTITSRISGRLTIRDNIQDKILGLIIGGVNGYLVVATLLSFLEYRITPENWVSTVELGKYPFPEDIITRSAELTELSQYFPIPLLTSNPLYLPVLLVIVILFVLIVML